MIDENKLIEELEAMPYIHGRFDHVNGNIDFINGIETWHEIVLNKIQSQPKVGEWIPCSERLPSTEKPYKSVLLQLKNSMVVGYVNKAGQWFVDSGDGWCTDLDDKPIAWMPLPEPYKE